jgi:hypothetical protein
MITAPLAIQVTLCTTEACNHGLPNPNDPGLWPYKSNMMREPGRHHDGRFEERQDHQVCLREYYL